MAAQLCTSGIVPHTKTVGYTAWEAYISSNKHIEPEASSDLCFFLPQTSRAPVCSYCCDAFQNRHDDGLFLRQREIERLHRTDAHSDASFAWNTAVQQSKPPALHAGCLGPSGPDHKQLSTTLTTKLLAWLASFPIVSSRATSSFFSSSFFLPLMKLGPPLFEPSKTMHCPIL